MAKNYQNKPSGIHKTGNQFFDSQSHGIGPADNRRPVRRKERIDISCLKSEKSSKGGIPTSNVHTLADRMSNRIGGFKKSLYRSR